jgi:membrane protease YdiL (CAAX protease family)
LTAAPHLFLAHIVAFLVIVPTLADHWTFARWQGRTDARSRVWTYRAIIGWQWLTAAAAVATYGFGVLRAPPVGATGFAWIPNFWLALAAAAVLVATVVRRDFAVARDPARTAELARGLGKMRAFLPHTARERAWWALLAVTSGTCEEVMFRGFLLHYFQGEPWGWGLVGGLAAACLIFGLGHLYQGLWFGLRAVVAAAVFAWLFIASGNLVLPIAVHVLTDLNVLVSIRLARRAPATARHGSTKTAS